MNYIYLSIVLLCVIIIICLIFYFLRKKSKKPNEAFHSSKDQYKGGFYDERSRKRWINY